MNQNGFTLIELMIIIAFIGILVILIIAGVSLSTILTGLGCWVALLLIIGGTTRVIKGLKKAGKKK